MHAFISPFDISPCFVLSGGSGGEMFWHDLPSGGREYESFFESCSDSLKAHSLDWSDLASISLVTGPAGFSATRVITLMLSTLTYTDTIELYWLSRFDLAEALGMSYPMKLHANRAEDAIAYGPEVWELREKGESVVSIDNEEESLISRSRIEALLRSKGLPLGRKTDVFKPLYIKKPHITLSGAHSLPIILP